MNLAIRTMRWCLNNRVAVEFLDLKTGGEVVAEFHFERDAGGVRVLGSEPDVLQWCEGSAEDVRRVVRAVQAFVAAAAPECE